MPDSTMLRQAAIGKLMDIQEMCNEAIMSDPQSFYGSTVLARRILHVIKGDLS